MCRPDVGPPGDPGRLFSILSSRATSCVWFKISLPNSRCAESVHASNICQCPPLISERRQYHPSGSLQLLQDLALLPGMLQDLALLPGMLQDLALLPWLLASSVAGDNGVVQKNSSHPWPRPMTAKVRLSAANPAPPSLSPPPSASCCVPPCAPSLRTGRLRATRLASARCHATRPAPHSVSS